MLDADHCEFLAVSFPKCLGPASLAWITLSLERLVTLGSTKSEHLIVAVLGLNSTLPHATNLTVISNKHDPVSWVDGGRTEVAFLDPHLAGSSAGSARLRARVCVLINARSWWI